MINKEFKPLNKEKKEILRNAMGSASSQIDFNKVRDEWKYDKDYILSAIEKEEPVRIIKVEQFMAFDTNGINSCYLQIIKEKLANDENIFISANNFGDFKIIENIEDVNYVFIAFDTLNYNKSECVSLLCIKTKDEDIRDIDIENKMIEDILRQRHLIAPRIINSERMNISYE